MQAVQSFLRLKTNESRLNARVGAPEDGTLFHDHDFSALQGQIQLCTGPGIILKEGPPPKKTMFAALFTHIAHHRNEDYRDWQKMRLQPRSDMLPFTS